MQRILHILLGVIFCVTVSAQKPKFYADTDARKIVEDSYVEVFFTIENGKGTNFELPKFKDFEVVSGPSRKSSTRIINGKMTSEESLGYGLKPKGIGNKVIPPASVKVNGKTMRTAPVTIEVVKASDKSMSDDKQIFVRAIVSDTIGYVGQQILLDYKLYTTLNVRQVQFAETQDFDGFYAEDLGSTRGYVREVVDGIEYYTRSISRVALFPQQTGTYELSLIHI